MVQIRLATIEDARIMGEIHYYTWLTTYARIIDEGYLRAQSIEKSIRIFKKNKCINHLVASLNNQVCGFSGYGASRDQDIANYGEIYALYVLKAFQNKGVGKALLVEVSKTLKIMGYSNIYLWVLLDNKQAISFYEQNGFYQDGNKKIVTLGKPLTEIRLIKKI